MQLGSQRPRALLGRFDLAPTARGCVGPTRRHVAMCRHLAVHLDAGPQPAKRPLAPADSCPKTTPDTVRLPHGQSGGAPVGGRYVGMSVLDAALGS